MIDTWCSVLRVGPCKDLLSIMFSKVMLLLGGV